MLALLEAARKDGITPLEVMVANMRRLWDEGDINAAADQAEKCAPYMHAKLSPIQRHIIMEIDPSRMTDEQLDAAIIAHLTTPKLIEGPQLDEAAE